MGGAPGKHARTRVATDHREGHALRDRSAPARVDPGRALPAGRRVAQLELARLTDDLLADFEPKGEVSRLYGAYRPKEGTSERALFVLDREGIIRWSYLSPIGVNPGADGILEALEALGEPTASNEQQPSLAAQPARESAAEARP